MKHPNASSQTAFGPRRPDANPLTSSEPHPWGNGIAAIVGVTQLGYLQHSPPDRLRELCSFRRTGIMYARLNNRKPPMIFVLLLTLLSVTPAAAGWDTFEHPSTSI